MADKFNTGDTVELKSGSPVMTVMGYKSTIFPDGSRQTSDTQVECTWFDQKKEKQVSTFHEYTLEKVDYE